MDKSQIIFSYCSVLLSYCSVLAWPIVAVLTSFWYRAIIGSLLPGATVTLSLVGQKVKLTIPELEQSISESLGGAPLDDPQRKWLKELYHVCRKDIMESDKMILRPLRDSGLIRAYPTGYLQRATAVEITPLGKLLVQQGLL